MDVEPREDKDEDESFLVGCVDGMLIISRKTSPVIKPTIKSKVLRSKKYSNKTNASCSVSSITVLDDDDDDDGGVVIVLVPLSSSSLSCCG